MFRRTLAVLAILTLGTAPALAKRVALVIGNGNYENAVVLPNPSNDAKAMSTKLRDLGFEVTAGYDQDYNGMRRTVAKFAKTARGADIALLFYAGHGMQVGGNNYLIPTDAKFEDETALDFETIPVDFILRQMSNDVKVQMVLLDACRDNPLARTLARRMSPSRSASVGSGLAELKIQETGGEGSVIAFATSPGDVALDGDGQNSPFTAALLRHIDTPNTPIQSVMTRVTGDVYRETDERQRPWVNASLIGEVFLNKTVETSAASTTTQVAALQSPTTAVATPAPSATTAVTTGPAANVIAWEREKALWDASAAGGTAADYEAYLASYPNGHFADIARNQIKRLGAVAALNPVATSTEQRTVTETATPAAAAVTNEMRITPGTKETERAIGWNKSARRQVQTRLTLAGFNTGRPDGAFGPKTRGAISKWQTANGILVTGFFTGPQYEVLKSQTKQEYSAYEAEQAKQRAAARQRAKTRTKTKTTTRSTTRQTNTAQRQQPQRSNTQQRQSSGISPAGAAFVGGLVGGIIGGAIGN